MSIPSEPTQSLLDRIDTLCQRVEENRRINMNIPPRSPRIGFPMRPNALPVNDLTPRGTPIRERRLDLSNLQSYDMPRERNHEMEKELQDIIKLTGILNINNIKYASDIKDLEHISELGSGTCGLVVKMKHKPSGAVIAVKQMRRSGNSEENKRIIRDLSVVLKSDCPFIVKCLGCFITESDVWICMELMSTCFDKLLKRHHIRIPEEILGKVTYATVKALDYLKEQHDVIHRDVKPSNILIDERGNVKLCDFGISGHLVDSKPQTGSVGCAAYLAPERIAPKNPNKPDYDIRADVWSLGITLLELATGQYPYRQCSSDFQLLTEIVNEAPPTLPPDCKFSPKFRSFITSCLMKNYKERPKFRKLLEHPFIKEAEHSTTDVAAWFARTVPPPAPVRRSPSKTAVEVPIRSLVDVGGPFSYLEASKPKIMLNSGNEETVSSQRTLFWQSRSRSRPAETKNEVANKFTTNLVPFGINNEPTNNYQNFYGEVYNNTNNVPLSSSRSPAFHKFWPITAKPSVIDHHHNNCPNDKYQMPELNRITLKTPTPANQIVYSSVTPQVNKATFTRLEDSNETTKESYFLPAQYKETPFQASLTREQSTFNADQALRPAHPFKSSFNREPSPLRLNQVAPMLRDQSPLRFSQETPRENSPQYYSSHGLYSNRSSPMPVPEPTTKDEEKMKYSSYLKFHFGGLKDGREQMNLPPPPRPVRHSSPSQQSSQSPEPPPRLGRFLSRPEESSPIALRRAMFEHSPIRKFEGSPSLSRRYITPSPPQPPPRRLTECSSVPGSPQRSRVECYRTRLHYTPEPQRRIYDSGQQF